MKRIFTVKVNIFLTLVLCFVISSAKSYANNVKINNVQNVYNLTNSYYIDKIKFSYQNEIQNAKCKINEDFRQIEINNLTIITARPASQEKINDIQNEATYLAFYKAIRDCYPGITKESVVEIFDKMQNQDIDSLFVDRKKTYNLTNDTYEASFEFILKKDSVDFFVWKYSQSNIITDKEGYIIVHAIIYDPKDTGKIEAFFASSDITFKVVEYRSKKATYLIKVDDKFNKAKDTQSSINFIGDSSGFLIEIKN